MNRAGLLLSLLFVWAVLGSRDCVHGDGTISAAPDDLVEAMRRDKAATMAAAEEARRWRAEHPTRAFAVDAAIVTGEMLRNTAEDLAPAFQAANPVWWLKKLVERDMPESETKRKLLRILRLGSTALSLHEFAVTAGVDVLEGVLNSLPLIADATGLAPEEALFWKVGAYPPGQEQSYIQELWERRAKATKIWIGRPGTHAGQEITGPHGLKLVWVPGGTFRMGSNDGFGDEQPVHEVQLDGFWIGKMEVTVGQWRAVIGNVPKYNTHGDSHPVVNVSWNDCQEFCRKLGLSLPTEAQREHAAGGPESRRYPWGDEWDNTKCCNRGNRGKDGKTFPVGSFPQGASWCGALDMAGNVYEWCADWYQVDYYKRAPSRNPPGPSSGRGRVLRGGCWDSGDPRSFRCAYRHSYLTPSYRFDYLGFRVSRTCR